MSCIHGTPSPGQAQWTDEWTDGAGKEEVGREESKGFGPAGTCQHTREADFPLTRNLTDAFSALNHLLLSRTPLPTSF